MEKDLTHGNTLKLIISFCIPLIGGAIFQQLYNIVDTMIVGRFVGVNALAAVGSTGSLNFLVLGFALGLTAGFGIPIAQAFGAKNHKLVLNSIMNAVYLCIFFAIVMTLLMHICTDDLLKIMKTPSDIMQDSYNYIIIIFYGLTATLSYNMLASISRALGDSKTPVIFLIISSVLNVGLDLFMIINLKLGVQGASLATVISQGISAILCFLYMRHKYPDLRFNKEDRKPNINVILKLLKIAVPMALQYSITAVGTVILQTAVNSLGSEKVAAIAAGQKIQMFFTQPMDMMGQTMATFCGQNLGAKKYKRIFKGIKESLIMVVAYGFIALIFMYFCGKYLALLFVDSSEVAIIADTQSFLVINSIFYFVLGILFVTRNVIQGLGRSALTMLAGGAELVARSFVALVLVNYYGFSAILSANPAAWVAAIIILIPTLIIILKDMKKTVN
jgi:putative MATE family efflux protein